MSESIGLPGFPVQSRFVLLDRPFANPGYCKICRAVDRPVVDFNANDDDGAIYFCTDCLTEVAKVGLDLVDASELREAQSTILKYETQLNKVGELRNEFAADLDDLFSSFVSNVTNISFDPVTASEEISDRSVGEGPGEINASESEPDSHDESISVEGPISVPTDSSDEPKSAFSL